jgi:hypothetical protein
MICRRSKRAAVPPSPCNGERHRQQRVPRCAFRSLSSRRESALILPRFRWSGLTSAATRTMGRPVVGPAARGNELLLDPPTEVG